MKNKYMRLFHALLRTYRQWSLENKIGIHYAYHKATYGETIKYDTEMIFNNQGKSDGSITVKVDGMVVSKHDNLRLC